MNIVVCIVCLFSETGADLWQLNLCLPICYTFEVRITSFKFYWNLYKRYFRHVK